MLCWPVALAAGPCHGGSWGQRGRGLRLVARGVAPAFGRRGLVRRAGAHLTRRLVTAAAAAILQVQVGMSMGPRCLWISRVTRRQGVKREGWKIVTLWAIGGYGGPTMPIFSLSVPLPLQFSLPVSLPVERQLSASSQPRIPLPVELSPSGYLCFPGSAKPHLPLLKFRLSVPGEAVPLVQPQAVIGRRVFSPDAAVSARAARGW